MRCMRYCTASLLTLLATVGVVGADVLVSPAAVVETNPADYDGTVPAVNMINQSGLDKPFTSGVTDVDSYFGSLPVPYAQANYANNWQGQIWYTPDPGDGFLLLDMGSSQPLTGLVIWNRSLRDVTIGVGDAPGGPFTPVATFTLADRQAFSFSYEAETIDFAEVHEARYLRIEIDSIYLIGNFGFGYPAVGEVAATVVPEPAAWTLLLIGAARLLRRRRA